LVVLTDLLPIIEQPGLAGLGPAVTLLLPDVRSDSPQIASIERQSTAPLHLFKLTGKSPGVAGIRADGRATILSAPFMAELIVTVFNKPGAAAGTQGDSFIAGFREGISRYVSEAVGKLLSGPSTVTEHALLLAEIYRMRRSNPSLSETPGVRDKAWGNVLDQAFCAGVLKGLQEGASALFDILKGTIKFFFDSEFQRQIATKARPLIQPWARLMGQIQGPTLPDGLPSGGPILIDSFVKLMDNRRAIGKAESKSARKSTIK
jgi:hypothetical protein